MTIKSFIQDQVLLPRLKENGLLVVYDPDQRYRELCAGIAAETTVVVDAGQSSIEARDLAMATLQRIGRMDSEIVGMLVYVPARLDHATAIRRIFAENAHPGFEVIDAIGGGGG